MAGEAVAIGPNAFVRWAAVGVFAFVALLGVFVAFIPPGQPSVLLPSSGFAAVAVVFGVLDGRYRLQLDSEGVLLHTRLRGHRALWSEVDSIEIWRGPRGRPRTFILHGAGQWPPLDLTPFRVSKVPAALDHARRMGCEVTETTGIFKTRPYVP